MQFIWEDKILERPLMGKVCGLKYKGKRPKMIIVHMEEITDYFKDNPSPEDIDKFLLWWSRAASTQLRQNGIIKLK